QSDGTAIRMLAQAPLPAALERFRGQYDFVIVDSAPVLPVADAQLIGQHVDGVIFSVLREVSRLPSVHAARERLSMLGVNILGAVITGMQSGSYDSAYQYIQAPLAKAPEG